MVLFQPMCKNNSTIAEPMAANEWFIWNENKTGK